MAMHEPTLYLLTALAEGRQHGYALLTTISEVSEGSVVLRPATLYAALERLTGQGLVRIAGEEAVDGRLRRYFELTDAGADALAAEQERLQRAAAAAQRGLRRLGRSGRSGRPEADQGQGLRTAGVQA